MRQLPAGYTRLTHIESTGTQYIDTGFKPNQDTRVVMDFQITTFGTAWLGLLAVRDSSANGMGNSFSLWVDTNKQYMTAYGPNVGIYFGTADLNRTIVDKDRNITRIGSSVIENPKTTFQSQYNLHLLNGNTGGTNNEWVHARLFSCQIFDNDVLARDYEPCINDGGEVGLYDYVYGTFYGNAGTGVFIAGDQYAEKSLGMAFARRRMMATPGEIVADPILNNNLWDVISKVSKSGKGANWWSVGDRKEIVLNGTVGHLKLSNYTIYAFILGFNHNAELEGSKRIHFQIGKTALSGGVDIALYDSAHNQDVTATGYFNMNSSRTISGGWASSQMRTNICGTSLTSYSGTIIAVIPAELRAVIKSVTKYTNNVGQSSDKSAVTATTDYFFLLSEYEVFGTTTNSSSAESSMQKRYDYYLAGNSARRYKHSATGTAARWLLRSPTPTTTNSFAIVESTGTALRNICTYGNGFAPGFCV